MIKQECFCDYCGQKCTGDYYVLKIGRHGGVGANAATYYMIGEGEGHELCAECYNVIADTITKLKGKK